MGGQSSQNQQTQQTQNSITQPWAPAQPLLQGILGQLQGNLGGTGVTGGEQGFLGQLMNPASQAQVNQNYQNYYNQTNPLASNTDYNPYNTPGLSDALGTLKSDITNSVNGQFAAAGRDMSGANTQALSRGLSQGLAPLLLGQYNQNVQNQQAAANNLYGAGNTNVGLQSGLQQQGLQAATTQQQLPYQNLGLLANIGIPIAGLGGQSTGNATGTGTQTTQLPWYAGISNVAGGLGSIFGGGQNSAARGILSFL